MQKKVLPKYIHIMRSLNVKVTNGIRAPHKAILLISIMDLISAGTIITNAIPPDERLADTFRRNWKKLTGEISLYSHFRCNPWTPYWHLKNEPFWHLSPADNSVNVDSLVPPGQTACISTIRTYIKHAKLDHELFELLQDCTYRDMLRETLINRYIIHTYNELEPPS